MVITLELYKEIRKKASEWYESAADCRSSSYFPKYRQKNIGMEKTCRGSGKSYSRKASVLTEEVVDFVRKCLDEDTRCKSRKTASYCQTDF